jgi:hypothetical protein
MSFKESDEVGAENEGMRRTGKLFDNNDAGDKPATKKRGRPRKGDDDVRPSELRDDGDD